MVLSEDFLSDSDDEDDIEDDVYYADDADDDDGYDDNNDSNQEIHTQKTKKTIFFKLILPIWFTRFPTFPTPHEVEWSPVCRIYLNP